MKRDEVVWSVRPSKEDFPSTWEYLTKVCHINEDWMDVKENGEEVEIIVDFLPF